MTPISRREFLCASGALAATAGGAWSAAAAAPAETGGTPTGPGGAPLHEALYYEPRDNGKVQCQLCPRGCAIEPGKRGHCGVRENRAGRLYSLVYGRPVTLHNDPIEKKPFFHVYPGSKAFSLATAGCNLNCSFCQNYDISQARPEDLPAAYLPPERVAELAAQAGARALAFTYSEPIVFYEYVADCARAARARGLGSVMVSNGSIQAAPLRALLPLLTAVKIDLKAFSQAFYARVCNARLLPVLETLKRLKDGGIWFEIVVLVIPTLNDNRDELKRLAAWIAKELGPAVPLHFTRFHPAYKLLNLPPTPVATLQAARQQALAEGCQFVYTGNLPGAEGDSTYCPHCRTRVLERYGQAVLSAALAQGRCPQCGTKIPGVWQ